MADELKQRATILVFREAKVLLVKERGKNLYWFPGGHIKAHEGAEQTAKRELQEETGLIATKLEHIGEFDGRVNHHVVFRSEATGDISLSRELSDYLWWDQRTNVQTEPHVQRLLNMLPQDKKKKRWPWSRQAS